MYVNNISTRAPLTTWRSSLVPRPAWVRGCLGTRLLALARARFEFARYEHVMTADSE